MDVRKRFFKVFFVIFKMFLDSRKEAILIKKKGYSYAQKKMAKRHEKRATELYDTAVLLKGAIIKLCQHFSSQPDFFPGPYIKILSTLQDNVPPVGFDEIEAVIVRGFGDHKKHFKKIEEESIGSASISQIHKAVLLNGKVVVLKILKPGIEKIIDTDCAIFYYVFKIISGLKFMHNRSDFVDLLSNLLDDFYKTTGDELNFKKEARNANQFRKLFKRYPYVKIPYIYNDLSSEEIIVMEYIEGDKISDTQSWGRRNNDSMIISRRLIELYIEQFLFSRLVHYDPHPGNILITDNSKLALLDFGMAGEITDDMKDGLWYIIGALIIKDYRKVIDTLDDLGFIRKGFNKYSLLPIIEFFSNEVIDVIKIEREEIMEVDFSPIRDEILDFVEIQAFNLPPNWAYMGKTVSSLLGLITTLNPDFKVYEEYKYASYRMIRNNFPRLLKEVSGRMAESFRSNLYTMVNLPGKLNNFIDNLEQGDHKLLVDNTEMNDKIDGIKEFIVRAIFFIFSFTTGSCSYVFYSKGEANQSFVFLILSCLTMVVSVFYRKRTLKSEIREQISKVL